MLALFQNGTIILPVFCYCNIPAYRYNVTYGDIMKSILVELTCPRCFYKTHKKSETLIMPEMEPQFRKELLEGVFFKKACPSCGKINTFLHTMIYVDKKHRFVLLVKPKSDLTDKDFSIFQSEKNCIRRYLCDPSQVAEKIRMLEDKLDDRAMELLKLKIILREKKKGRLPKNVIYQDQETDTIWFHVQHDEEEDVIGIWKTSYDAICSKLPPQKNQFEEIDSYWAVDYLKQSNESH